MKTYILQRVCAYDDMSYPTTFKRLFNSDESIMEFIANDSGDDIDDEHARKAIANGSRIYAGEFMYTIQEVEPNMDMMKDLVWLCKELVGYANGNNIDFVNRTIESINDFIDRNGL